MNDHTTNEPTNEIPYGYCHCGCGQKTNPAQYTNRKIGWVKGQPLLFVHGHNQRSSFVDRFWKYVTPGDPNECWTWRGCTRNGYGALGVNAQPALAHRVSWEIHNGPIPEGLIVCHKCDNRPCVNPRHLFLGTQLDNMRDMDAKGRRVTVCNPRKGETHPCAKLTPKEVVEIRQLVAQGISQRKVGRMFGIGQQSVGDIVHRKIWKHVP